MTQFQPTLPAPTLLNTQELDFIDSSPPGLFPENQNSNFGALRKVFADKMKEVADQIATLYGERFVFTASETLEQWEQEIGLPVATTLSDQQRRSRIQARRQQGAFTRTKRKQVIEAYLQATFGQTTRLSVDGVPFTASGLPLYSDVTSLIGLYTVTENITNYSYSVDINSTAQIDAAGLTRELQRITPAHISFSITYSGTVPAQTIRKSGGAIAVSKSGGTEANNIVTNANRRARITWGDMVVPDVGGGGSGGSSTRRGKITWASFQTP